MNLCNVGKMCVVALPMLVFAGFGLSKAIAAPSNSTDAQDGVQVLTRGPVHEAFAETVTFDPEPGIVAPKMPPAAIEELPPDQKPEGANVAWIPGYWAWDDERNDYLWVSGIWRDLPPNRQWVPGYWGQADKGAQWTSGYWADAKASEIEYLPEPPASVEAGPNIAASSPDQNWLPGCWVWQQNRYMWRPGSWASMQPDWDWMPAHYVWSPRGYMFVDGYWDYSVGRRGVLFAPVYFDANVYAQQGFSYSPAVVINPAVFASQLFLRPNYQHYYFGDYYGSSYATAGFYPWFSYNSNRVGYDPIFAQQRWQHRQDPNWAQTIQADFQNRIDHPSARSPQTWAAQQSLMAGAAPAGEKRFVIAAPLDQVSKSNDSPSRFQPIDQAERQKLGQNGQDVRKFLAERQKLETPVPATAGALPSQKVEPTKVTLSASPIMAKSPDPLQKTYVPPQAYQVPQTDLKVEPKPRVAQSSAQAQPYTVNKFPQSNVPPAVTQNAPPSQLQPKNESKTTASEPKTIPQGQPPSGPPAKLQGGPGGIPPATSNDKQPVAPKDNSKAEPKK